MDAPVRPENKVEIQDDQPAKLMVKGFVCPERSTFSFEIRRGMPIVSKDGLEVGKVAAIVLNRENRQATYILLSRLPEILGYWSVSVDLIAEVHEENVQLSIPAPEIESLPQWQST